MASARLTAKSSQLQGFCVLVHIAFYTVSILALASDIKVQHSSRTRLVASLKFVVGVVPSILDLPVADRENSGVGLRVAHYATFG